MDATETANLRIPAILLPSYNHVIKTPSGRADLKRISVRCGVCRLLRYYSLTRGITRINRVAACEACRHCYQAYKREPVPLHCTKGDGSCWRNLMFPKTKCRCCWVTQMVERTPISQQLYIKIMPLLPEYIRGEMRGRPILASSLTMAERGFLTLEVHTGTDWRDVTLEQAVIQQRMNLSDSLGDGAGPDSDAVESTSTDQLEESNTDSSNTFKSSCAEDGSAAGGTDDKLAGLSADIPSSGGSSSSLGGGGGGGDGDGSSSGSAGGMALPHPPVKSVATRGKRGVKFRGSSSFSSSFQSKLSGVSTADSDETSSASENQFKSFGVPRSKATKGTRGSRRGRAKRGQSKVDRVMAGIKEGLYGLSMSEESSGGRRPADSLGKRPGGLSSAFTSGLASSNTTSDSSGPNSGAASPTPMDEDVTVEEEFEESSILRSPPAPVITKMAPPKNRDKKLPPDPMIGLLHDEQKKYLKDFNPRNSARVRRKKDRLEYLDNPRTTKAVETLVHDHKGRFVGADRQLHDTCDCLQLDCPGCHFPCPKCRSTKCGAECRTSRKWFYERVDVEGTEQFFVNRFIKV